MINQLFCGNTMGYDGDKTNSMSTGYNKTAMKKCIFLKNDESPTNGPISITMLNSQGYKPSGNQKLLAGNPPANGYLNAKIIELIGWLSSKACFILGGLLYSINGDLDEFNYLSSSIHIIVGSIRRVNGVWKGVRMRCYGHIYMYEQYLQICFKSELDGSSISHEMK